MVRVGGPPGWICGVSSRGAKNGCDFLRFFSGGGLVVAAWGYWQGGCLKIS